MTGPHPIMLITLSMVCFSIEDLLIKVLSQSLPTGQLTVMLGFGGALVFALVALFQRQWVLPLGPGTLILYLRSACEGLAAVFIIVGLAMVPLSSFAAVFQASPLVMTMGAAILLREQVGWRRWLAVLVGFVGVLLIIQPGTVDFDPAILLVLGAVLTISARDLLSRRLPAALPSTVVSFQGFASLLLSGPVLILLTGQGLVAPNSFSWLLLGATVSVGVAGYYAIVLGTRMGDVAVLAPFRYTRLVFAMIFGIVIFAERPDPATYLGAVLIIGSGIYTYWREQRLRQYE